MILLLSAYNDKPLLTVTSLGCAYGVSSACATIQISRKTDKFPILSRVQYLCLVYLPVCQSVCRFFILEKAPFSVCPFLILEKAPFSGLKLTLVHSR